MSCLQLSWALLAAMIFSALPVCAQSQAESDKSAAPNHFEPSPDKPMQFRMAGSGGNCLSCTWIAAEGIISEGTAKEFEDFLFRTKSARSGVFVHLNSQGGNVAEAIKLGRLFRSNNLNTAVSQTIGVERASDDPQFDKYVAEYPTPQDNSNPQCVSACALAFVGGHLRLAEAKNFETEYLGFGRIGPVSVHQFYAPSAWETPEANTSSAIDRVLDQALIAQISRYLDEMQIAPGFLSIMATTPPFDVHVLTESELFETNVVNDKKYEATLNGYKNGVAVVEVRFQRWDGRYTIELFCQNQKMRMLLSADWHVAQSWDDIENWGYFENVLLQGSRSRVKLLTTKSTLPPNGVIEQLLFEFEGEKIGDVVSRKRFLFEQEPGFGNRYSGAALASMSFEIPDDFEGLHVIPKTCL